MRPLRIGVSALLMTGEAGQSGAGIPRYCFRIIEALRHRPEPYTWVVLLPEDTRVPDAWTQDSKLELVRLRFKGRLQRQFWEHFAARTLVRKHRLDLWFSTAQSIPMPCGCPRAVMIHDLIPMLFPQYFRREKVLYQTWALGYAMKHANRILVNSQATADSILKLGGPRAFARCRLTPLGPGNDVEPLAADAIDAGLEPYGLRRGRYILALGTLEPRKNLQTLFRAFAQLPADFRAEHRLAIGGGKGWKEAPIFEELQRSGVADAVDFLGYVPDADLSALFGGCAAFVFPSLYEGFGMPVLEAMKAGAPVLCSDRPMLREVGAEAVRYFDPEQPEALAALLQEVVGRPAEQDAWRKRGLERAAAFNWESCGLATVRAFEELLNPKNRNGVHSDKGTKGQGG